MRSRHRLYFCSREHKELAQSIAGNVPEIRPAHYGSDGGIHTYRTRALRQNKACVKCGYSHDVRMLDVDHVDGNRKNNDIGNLQVLCVWCHALKTRRVEEHGRLSLYQG